MADTKLSKDILQKIKADFSVSEQKKVISILEKEITNGLNVPGDQFARSILFLSTGSLTKLQNDYLTIDDPRDVIMEAEEKAGNPGHWFGISFEEMRAFSQKKQIKPHQGFIVGNDSIDDGIPF